MANCYIGFIEKYSYFTAIYFHFRLKKFKGFGTYLDSIETLKEKSWLTLFENRPFQLMIYFTNTKNILTCYVREITIDIHDIYCSAIYESKCNCLGPIPFCKPYHQFLFPFPQLDGVVNVLMKMF